MKLLKFKLNKILKENSFNICETFEQRNDSFNIKLKNYFKSEKYIKGKEIEKDNLNQNKKGFSSSHDLLNYYYEPSVDKRSNEEIMAYSIINNLSSEERKILSLNPKYFLIDKKKFLLKKLNIIVNDNLKNRILREDENNNRKNLKEENKTDLNNNIKRIFNRKRIYKLKINEKKINNKMIEYRRNNFIKHLSKNRIIDNINSNINEYYKKYYSFCHQNFLKRNENKKKEYFYRMFNYPLSYKMTREYQQNRNDSRIHQKEILHQLKMKEKLKDDSLQKKIKNFQNIIKTNYNKNKM